jgi:hypothetical protein
MLAICRIFSTSYEYSTCICFKQISQKTFIAILIYNISMLRMLSELGTLIDRIV